MPLIKSAKNESTCLLIPLQFEGVEWAQPPFAINAFMRFDYWRVVFGLPILFAIIQIILMATVYNYESPKYLKQQGKDAELNDVMGKIYSGDLVKSRIDEINVDSGEKRSITLRETVCDPRYSKATIVGSTLSLV